MSKKRIRMYFIFPICMLLLNIVQELAIYELKIHVDNKWIFVLIIVLLCGLGFSVVDNLVVPQLGGALEKGHKVSKTHGGSLGVTLFMVGSVALIYYAYYNIYYLEDMSFLIPRAWR